MCDAVESFLLLFFVYCHLLGKVFSAIKIKIGSFTVFENFRIFKRFFKAYVDIFLSEKLD